MTDTTSTQNKYLTTDVSKEKWMEILKLLTPGSCKTLQSALNQFSQENGYNFSHDIAPEYDCGLETLPKLPDASELFQPQQPQSMIIESAVLSTTANSQFAHTLLPSQVTLFNTQAETLNTLTTPIVFTGIPLSRPTELQFDQVTTGALITQNPTSKGSINGLDTLAAAALANTNSETNVTSTTSVTTIQQQVMAPVLDSRQSPTIGQTPKRLAATAATRAEEEANRGDPLIPEGGVRFVDSKRARLSLCPQHTSLLRDSKDNLDEGGESNTCSHLLLNGVTCKPEEGIDGMDRAMMLDMNQTFTNQLLPTPCNNANGELSWPHQNFELKRSESMMDVMSGSSNQRQFMEENPSEDEAARKEKRRERNRVAAAKCRQNRQNQIERLQEKKVALEKKNDDVSLALTALRQQRKHLLENIKQHALGGCPESTSFLEINCLELGPISGAAAPGYPSTKVTTNVQECVLPGLNWALQNNTNSSNTTPHTSIRLSITPTDGNLLPLSSLISQAVSTAAQLPPKPTSVQEKGAPPSGPVRPNTLVTKKDDPNDTNKSSHPQQPWLSPITPCLLAAAVEKKRIDTPNAWVNTAFAPPPSTTTASTGTSVGANQFVRAGVPLRTVVEEVKITTATSG